MKLKAFYLAFALVVSIGPASATGLSPSDGGINIAQTDISHLFRDDRPSANVPAQDIEVPLFTARSVDEPGADPGGADAATAQISDALKAKIRAIVAFARQQARNAPDGSQILRSRIRVRCAAKQVVAKRVPSTSATPALLQSERPAEPELIASTVEICSIKLLQLRRNTPSEPPKRSFEVTLPPLDAISP